MWCVCVVCRGQRLISGVSYCYPPLSFEKDSFIESGACHSHSSQARSWRAPGTFLSPPPPLSDSSARVMDVCWAQLFHECWGYKLRFSCTCSHNFTYRAIPRPQSYSVKKKKDGMTHIWRSTLPIGCGLTRGASLGETDYGISHFISHWEQVSKATHKPAGGLAHICSSWNLSW